MSKRLKILLAILFIALIIGNIFFASKFLTNIRELEQIEEEQQINDKVLSFTNLFMAKVLRGGTTVSFDDRLLLENSVRALNDKEIFSAWEKFTKAGSQAEVQQAFYNLFDRLLAKIKS